MVEIAGTELFRGKSDRLSGRTPEELYDHIYTLATRLLRIRGVVVPCTRAGRGPSNKSTKVQVAVLTETMLPDMSKCEWVERQGTYTVPLSTVVERNGQLYVATWPLVDKIGDSEDLPKRHWLYADECWQEICQWFEDGVTSG